MDKYPNLIRPVAPITPYAPGAHIQDAFHRFLDTYSSSTFSITKKLRIVCRYKFFLKFYYCLKSECFIILCRDSFEDPCNIKRRIEGLSFNSSPFPTFYALFSCFANHNKVRCKVTQASITSNDYFHIYFYFI